MKGGTRAHKTYKVRHYIGAASKQHSSDMTSDMTNSGLAMRSPSMNAVEDPRSAPFHLCQSGTHPDDTLFVEGLRMAQPFSHQPVMLNEIVELFMPVPAGVLIDATLGGAGHAKAILAACPQLKLLGLDQDEAAILAASENLQQFIEQGRVEIRNLRFDAMRDAVHDSFSGEPVVGVLFDLGVSSPQLDWAERGFSYRAEGPLDMRMDRRQSRTAAEVVNHYHVDVLVNVLRDGGEEQFARRIARAIVGARPIENTVQLADVVRNAIPAPARRRPGDPAKRSFQAIRMEVNRELEVLGSAIDQAIELVAPGGRVVTLAYHSGEDRLVKRRFVNANTGGCTCPPGLPCVCGSISTHRLLTRGARKPSAAEAQSNPRAQSARLRAIEALDVNGGSHA